MVIRCGLNCLINLCSALGEFRSHCSGCCSFLSNGLLWLLGAALLRFENYPLKHLCEQPNKYYPKTDFTNLKFFDPIRIIIQSIFLLFVRVVPDTDKRINNYFYDFSKHVYHKKQELTDRLYKKGANYYNLYTSYLESEPKTGNKWRDALTPRRIVLYFAVIVCIVLTLWCITQPMSMFYQLLFMLLMLELAWLMLRSVNNFTILCLMLISVMISARYLFWRYAYTLNYETYGGFLCSVILILAETYTFMIMLLGYFQLGMPYDRKPEPITIPESEYPTVDVYIPTYNEPLDVVKPTVFGCMAMDWPADKLRVYILDDGTRDEFREFAKEAGCGYIIRKEHVHAKAGNINHAMTLTDGEFIAIFDCDHVPVHAFLQMTMGVLIKNDNMAMVQTPHHFYSSDPFEKNLDVARIPQENSLFHDFIQKGNDHWNATMFCGSCAVIRRAALDDVGGIAIETVTEDAHTSLKMSRHGWDQAFIDIPLAAGLATETLAAHISQRIRWARGMVQVFRVDNPLCGKGLTFGQRLCYLNAMMHFLHGLPRIIFILAPLPYLLFGTYVIYAQAIAIIAYVVPHMVYSTITNMHRHQGYRSPLWSGIYETVLSWYIAVPTTLALINPKLGKFNVTSKGNRIEEDFFDWNVSKPYLVLIALNLIGLAVGTYDLFFNPRGEIFSVMLNLGWLIYNMLILGGAVAAVQEKKQIRRYPRIVLNLPSLIEIKKERYLQVRLHDFSQGGVGIKFDDALTYRILVNYLQTGQEITFYLPYNNENYGFRAVVRSFSRDRLGLQLKFDGLEDEKRFNYCTLARSDLWSNEKKETQGFWENIKTVLKNAVAGYRYAFEASPAIIKCFFSLLAGLFRTLLSFVPQLPKMEEQNVQKNFN